MKSHISNDNYCKTFLKRRLPVLLIPYLIINYIYYLFFLKLGREYKLIDFINGIIEGDPIVLYSWYVIAVIFFYISFYMLMKIMKKAYIWILCGSIVVQVGYLLFCVAMDYGNWWYNSSMAFSIGILWALCEQKVNTILKRVRVYSVSLIMVAICFFTAQFCIHIVNDNTNIIFKMIRSNIFVILWLLIVYKVRIGNKILEFVGDVSYEVYLLQGIIIKFVISISIFIKNEFLETILIVAVTLLLAVILRKSIAWGLLVTSKIMNSVVEN